MRKKIALVGAGNIGGTLAHLIALKEFNEKKIPFIIKRPMPNGGCEYWKFEDLEIIA